jgi:predicted AAA+ superfamily ATPase
MKRIIDGYLQYWKTSSHRKPLLLRGARQVGKTFAIRQFSHYFSDFVEINFELTPHFKAIFEQDLDPIRILHELNILSGRRIIPGQTLLFFDEVQVQPKAVTALRYFYEKIPDLHVIAAGSLLDFALENISIPVGRMEMFYLHPLSFLEFLKALKEDLLLKEIITHPVEQAIAEPIHKKLLGLLGNYMAIGGLPEAVQSWVAHQDIFACTNIQQAIANTYQQDFQKYAKKHQLKYVDLLFKNIPRQLGNAFRFNQVPGEYRKRDLQPSLELLIKANVAQQVFHTAGNGIPLGAEIKLDSFKTIFLDIALNQTILGLDRRLWLLDSSTEFINKGEITEAFVGQELLAYMRPDKDPQLFYWKKEERGAQAEIDYLVQVQEKILPVEVKSGEGRSLKSLRLFLETHPKSPYGIRFSIHNYSNFNNIHSYPLYAVAAVFAEDKERLQNFIE